MSSSQKKKERRRMRYERNVKKEKEHKAQAWEDGKLILENHNGREFSPEFSVALCDRIAQYIGEEYQKAQTPEDFIRGFRKYKQKAIQAVILYNPGIPECESYQKLVKTLSDYWDLVVKDLKFEEFYGEFGRLN